MRILSAVDSNSSPNLHARVRFSLRAALALGALALVALQGPAMAQQRGGAQRDGNWMREYVQLRVAEKNLEYANGTMTAAEIDRIIRPRIVGGSVAGADGVAVVRGSGRELRVGGCRREGIAHGPRGSLWGHRVRWEARGYAQRVVVR